MKQILSFVFILILIMILLIINFTNNNFKKLIDKQIIPAN